MANSALHETAFERIESYVYLAHFQLIILVDFDETGRRNALSDAVQAIHYVQRLTQRTLLTRRLIFLKEGFLQTKYFLTTKKNLIEKGEFTYFGSAT